MNVADAPLHKLSDRWALLERVVQALLADADCRYTFRERWTTDQLANWYARRDVLEAQHNFP